MPKRKKINSKNRDANHKGVETNLPLFHMFKIKFYVKGCNKYN